MASAPQKPFSLRPWPHGDRKPKNLGEFIARVNAERGGFRTVTEESLRKEIEAQENGVDETNGADEMDLDSEDEAESTNIKLEDIVEARNEVIKNAEVAHQNAMLALDFVSLLLTKEIPNQARTTLSNALRDHVGLGTLGATKLATSNLSEARLQDNKMVSTGWKFTDIDRTVNSVLTSASRLQKEISLETKYWAEVLAVSDSGWAVSRVPNERHTLGVRYGFSEAAATFRNTSLAAMRRSEEGTVDLDCGRTIGESQRLLVTIEKNGKVVGRSSLPKPLPSDAALQDRVLEARDTIFNQELWHEINREGRSLLSYNVRLEESSITYDMEEDTKVIFSLQALGDEMDHSQDKHSEDGQAASISVMLNLLLSYAHEQNNHRRSQPSAIARFQSSIPPPYALLRPIIAHLQHGRTLAKATKFISDLTTILQSAGISTAHYKLTEPPISPSMARNTPGSRSLPSEALIHTLLEPLKFQFQLVITPEAQLLVHGQTTFFPIVTTMYQIRLLPPSVPSNQDASPSYNTLASSFPPTDAREGYPDLRDVIYYVRQATARALTDHLEASVYEWTSAADGTAEETKDEDTDDGARDEPKTWIKTIKGTVLQNPAKTHELIVEVANEGDEDLVDEPAPETDDLLPLELRLYGVWQAGGKANKKKWAWSIKGASKSAEQNNLVDAAKAVVKGQVD